MNATHTTTTTHQQTHTHYALTDPHPYTPTHPGIDPDAITRIMVSLLADNEQPSPPQIVASLRSGRHVVAGFGVDPDTRDDTLLDTFAHLVDDAQQRSSRHDHHHHERGCLVCLERAEKRATSNIGGTAIDRLAPVRHLGATGQPLTATADNPLHTCQHRNKIHDCKCPALSDHGHRLCTLDTNAIENGADR